MAGLVLKHLVLIQQVKGLSSDEEFMKLYFNFEGT
jgi:hypothetical protein